MIFEVNGITLYHHTVLTGSESDGPESLDSPRESYLVCCAWYLASLRWYLLNLIFIFI